MTKLTILLHGENVSSKSPTAALVNLLPYCSIILIWLMCPSGLCQSVSAAVLCHVVDAPRVKNARLHVLVLKLG
jgi:hypothetical protein